MFCILNVHMAKGFIIEKSTAKLGKGNKGCCLQFTRKGVQTTIWQAATWPRAPLVEGNPSQGKRTLSHLAEGTKESWLPRFHGWPRTLSDQGFLATKDSSH